MTAARAYYFDVMGDLWNTLLAGGKPSERQVALFTTTFTHVVGACVEVVQLIYKAAGGTAVYQKGPFDRCLRDVSTNEPARGRVVVRNGGSSFPRPSAFAMAFLKKAAGELGRKRSSADATLILPIDDVWWPVPITI